MKGRRVAKRFAHLQATALRDTEKALLVLVGGREVWVPKSQIEDASEVQEPGDTGVLVVPRRWLGRLSIQLTGHLRPGPLWRPTTRCRKASPSGPSGEAKEPPR